jgi:hypothetical protein
LKQFWWVYGCCGAPSWTIMLHISEICPSFGHYEDEGNILPKTLVFTNDLIRCENQAYCYMINTSRESLTSIIAFVFIVLLIHASVFHLQESLHILAPYKFKGTLVNTFRISVFRFDKTIPNFYVYKKNL